MTTEHLRLQRIMWPEELLNGTVFILQVLESNVLVIPVLEFIISDIS